MTIVKSTRQLAAHPVRRVGLARTLMLLVTVIWAANIVAGKYALEGFSPLALAQLRMSAAACLYVGVHIVKRGIPPLRQGLRGWGYLALMAVFGISLNQVFFIGGIAGTSVVHVGLLQALGPIVVLLISAGIGLEAFTRNKIGGMVISFTGVALLVRERPAAGSGAHWTGDALVLGGIVVFSIYTVLVKRVAERYDPLTLNAFVFTLGALFLAPFSASAVARVSFSQIPLRAWLGYGFMVLFASFTAYLMFAFALEHLPASSVAAFYYLEPVIAALLGIWLLAERVSWPVFAGGALILGGVYLTERSRGGKQAASQPAALS